MATLRQKISRLIKETSYCTLVTVNPKAEPRCRLMGSLGKGMAKVVYLATYVESNKVKEIKANPRVSLVYVGEDQSYACVSGRARIRTDQKTKSKLWQKEWLRYFPAGKTDANYAVIEVAPKRIDYVDAETFEPQVLKL